MHPLIALGLRCRPDSDPCRLARGALVSGDPAALPMLWDSLWEMEDSVMLELQIGEAYLVGTVTFYYTGRVRSVSLMSVVLTEAARVFDTGRFSDALRTGKLVEVEPYPDGAEVLIPVHAITDACSWAHKLPRERSPR